MINYPAVKTILEQDTTVQTNLGCTFEYNLNSMVDNISLSGAQIARINSGSQVYYPFETLFPISSIIKQNRPQGAGIKYGVFGDVGYGTYRNPRSTDYTIDYRSYYPGADTFYKYYLADKNVGLDVTATYPKTILANKIVVKFEISHSIPSSWTVYSGASSIATGTSAAIKTFKTGVTKNYDAGNLTLYYNGTSWSTTEPSSIASPVSINSLRIVASAPSNQYIGLIELSPKLVVDVSDYVVSMSTSKDSSVSNNDILPIGSVSANSLSLQIASYEDDRRFISFNKSMTFSSSYTYLYKQVEIKPYYKIYHSSGTLSDSKGTYHKVNQGLFFMDSWNSSEFGDVSINALDSAKILQETISPNLLCKQYSATGILRYLLDSIGFTNYKFNMGTSDTSILSPRYWWSDENIQVWTLIQDICRDSQMIATFDENNILQFYSRDYIFNSSRSVDWGFRYSADGSNLPNIMSFEKDDIPSANKVKVLWQNVYTSEYIGNSQPLWESSNSFMGALSLDQNLYSNQGAGSYVSLSAITTNTLQAGQILYEYNGYLVIDSEIIEYDAIQYQYKNESGTWLYVDITGPGDELKYLGLGVPGSDNYKPSGKYRIKTRGCFNTPITNHYADARDIIGSWQGYTVTWI